MKSPQLMTDTVITGSTSTTATTATSTSSVNCDEESRSWGLKYARDLDYTDEEYEEAIKRIGSPPSDENQLLTALMDVSKVKQQQTATMMTTLTQQQQQQPLEVTPSSNYSSSYFTLSNASSCYSSITSCFVSSSSTASSSSNQSLDNLAHPNQQPQMQNLINFGPDIQSSTHLRNIYIDGSNVAKTHGKNVDFSWKGIMICVDWFLSRQHKVKVFVPMDKCCSQQQKVPLFGSATSLSDDNSIVEYLTKLDILIQTPTGCNDDLFIIEAAKLSNGIIVSNDLFRDEKRRLNDPELDKIIYFNRLPYVFDVDRFIPARDPRGPSGPTLGEFLLVPPPPPPPPSSTAGDSNKPCSLTPISGNHHNKLYRTISHQRYSSTQRNQPKFSSQYYNNYQQQEQQSEYNQHVYHRSLKATKSLPFVEQPSPPSHIRYYNSATGQTNQGQSSASGQQQQQQQLISISRTNYLNNSNKHREPQQGNRANALPPPELPPPNNEEDMHNMKHKLRKSVSIAYGNTIATNDTREPALAAATSDLWSSQQQQRRHATPLGRTRSHM